MLRKALALLVVVAAVGVVSGMVGLLGPRLADADQHGATRMFSAASVPAGGELMVTITVTGNLGSFGAVKETLPEGFSYVSSTLTDSAVFPDGLTITFALFGVTVTEFTYTVTVSEDRGTYDFNGVVLNESEPPESETIGGDAQVMVEAADMPMPMATRAFSTMSVPEGGNLTVTIAAMDYGQIGAVVETMPPGFTYVSSTPASPERDGRKLTFALLGPNETVTYTFTASSIAGPHTFSGELIDDQRTKYTVSGAASVTVQAVTAPGDPSATRSFSESSLGTGDELVVTVTVGNYGDFGQVAETLPAGFMYESSSLDEEQVRTDTDVRVVKFGLLAGTGSFTYTVVIPDMADDYTFSGNLYDSQGMSHAVGGDSQVVVGPNATRSFPSANVRTGSQLTVTVQAQDYGDFGQIAETLPSGFDYVSSSLEAEAVRIDGQMISFGLFGSDLTLTYTVTAPGTPRSYTFSGELSDDQGMTHTVGGDNIVRVEAPPSRRGGGGGGGGIVTPRAGTVAAGSTASSPAPSETLPAQAIVRTPNAGVVRITIAPQQATPLLQGFNVAGTVFDIAAPPASLEEPLVLTFLVRTQAAAKDIGVLKDGMTVADCSGASGQASPDPCVASRAKAGTTVSVKVLTSDASSIWEFRSPTPAATPIPAPTPTPEPTVAPTVAAPTPEPTVAPTMRPTPRPTVPVVLPTPRPTAVPTPEPTAAPTAMPTPEPTAAPTAMPTPEPTTTPVAPEPSPTAAPEPTVVVPPATPPPAEAEGFSVWLIALIIVAAVAVVVGGGFAIVRARGR